MVYNTRGGHVCCVSATMFNEDTYEIPLQDQRVFGAIIKRKRVQFVPSSACSSTTPATGTTPAKSVSDLYLSLVLPKRLQLHPHTKGIHKLFYYSLLPFTTTAPPSPPTASAAAPPCDPRSLRDLQPPSLIHQRSCSSTCRGVRVAEPGTRRPRAHRPNIGRTRPRSRTGCASAAAYPPSHDNRDGGPRIPGGVRLGPGLAAGTGRREPGQCDSPSKANQRTTSWGLGWCCRRRVRLRGERGRRSCDSGEG